MWAKSGSITARRRNRSTGPGPTGPLVLIPQVGINPLVFFAISSQLLAPNRPTSKPFLDEDNVIESASAQADCPIDAFGSLCAEEHATSVQNSQAASSITTASSSMPQSQTLAQDTMDVPPPPGCCVSPVSRVLARIEFDWGCTLYIRQDLQGSFHTYPGLGGPFRSLQEADEAIDGHLDELRHPTMFKQQDGVSTMDIMIRRSLYWPDGKCMRSKSCAMQRNNDQMCRLVQSLVDKYNEDHRLLGVSALSHPLYRALRVPGYCVLSYSWNFGFPDQLRDAEAELRVMYKEVKAYLRAEGASSSAAERLVLSMLDGGEVVDQFDGATVWWSAHSTVRHVDGGKKDERLFKLHYHESHRELVLGNYLPSVQEEGPQDHGQ
ncbi:hypothetical protein C2845_PM01G23160 [Panicum miliaceum]|uniref:AAA-type ATPase N-terminal domain-containing protein n=1 Tax=Panicum miliaceum TaxID=4540 RepID=A0A3L6TRU4_PANMI|nr:hypothetical protein C2845_PM01G23160 [Panicum miliaceum]